MSSKAPLLAALLALAPAAVGCAPDVADTNPAVSGPTPTTGALPKVPAAIAADELNVYWQATSSTEVASESQILQRPVDGGEAIVLATASAHVTKAHPLLPIPLQGVRINHTRVFWLRGDFVESVPIGGGDVTRFPVDAQDPDGWLVDDDNVYVVEQPSEAASVSLIAISIATGERRIVTTTDPGSIALDGADLLIGAPLARLSIETGTLDVIDPKSRDGAPAATSAGIVTTCQGCAPTSYATGTPTIGFYPPGGHTWQSLVEDDAIYYALDDEAVYTGRRESSQVGDSITRTTFDGVSTTLGSGLPEQMTVNRDTVFWLEDSDGRQNPTTVRQAPIH